MLRRTTLLKVFVLLLGMVIVCVVFSMSPHRSETKTRTQRHETHLDTRRPADKKLVLFHLDLKGAPPKMSFLLDLLPLVRKAGANGLLLEYEDMFPWSGILRNISARNAYSREEVEMLLRKAADLEMTAIPLVQTFGHLEFVLKLDEFRHLRELDSFPQELCPAKHASINLIKEMIRQMMEVHRKARFIHIGCDEVYHLAACPVCSSTNPRLVFTNHVRRVANHIRNTYNSTPIIWDDMLRRWSPMEIEESGLGQYVEPMVWVYIEDIPRLVPHFQWFTYKKTFHQMWGASAFKGAFGEQAVFPDLPRHLENNLVWQRLMDPPHSRHSVMTVSDFRGLAVTGWSRYDHFAVLAELLPVAIPSLILALTLSKNYQKAMDDKTISQLAIKEMFQILDCPPPYPFYSLEEMKSDKLHWFFSKCKYPGSQMYHVANALSSLRLRLGLVAQERESNGWVSQYNQRHNFSSPYRVLQLFPEEGYAGQRLLKDLGKLRNEIQDIFSNFYDNFTIAEWIEQKLQPMQNSLNEMGKSFQILLNVRTWPRRPITAADGMSKHRENG